MTPTRSTPVPAGPGTAHRPLASHLERAVAGGAGGATHVRAALAAAQARRLDGPGAGRPTALRPPAPRQAPLPSPRPAVAAAAPGGAIQGCFPAGLAALSQASRGTGALQPKLAGSATQLPPGIAALAERGGGQPLPEPVRKRMEAVFGASFADVRVHVGAEAAALGAAAFTRGSHIHFAPGRYQPQTIQGRRLLGHELTHVLQQRAGRVRNPFAGGTAVVHDPRLEAEAERMAVRVAEGWQTPAASGPAKRPVPLQPARRPAPAARSATSIQRAAALATNLATESSQSTYLTAMLANGTQLCSNLASSAAGHSEDRFIDEILPAAADDKKLDSKSDNVIFIALNRSPCTSTDRQGDGHTTCNKGGATPGCAERLIALVTAGFTRATVNYPIKIVLDFRNVYDMSANSILAIKAMVATGRIACEFLRAGGSSTRFMGTSATRDVSKTDT